MRMIKSRAKAADGSGWVNGYPVPFPDGENKWAFVGNMFLSKNKECIETSMFVEVIEDTIGNYCGFTDYFNTPAFDGDIIEIDENRYGIIRYGAYKPSTSRSENTAFGFFIEWYGAGACLYRKDVGYWLEYRNAVIRGNIFDNPDLLERLSRDD